MHSDTPLAILGGLSIKAFFKDYWQKKPLFVKNAFPDIGSMISADELAGLSLEPHIESRLIQEHKNNQWQLEHGPFSDTRFSELPESHWTLIVQAVDLHIPEFSQFLDTFKFIPSWRLDDIMITYATDQGSVGPHYDYYDVFLIQLDGKRQWQSGQQCDEDTALLPDLPVRILSQFDTNDTWNVEPGDLLYLPPGLAHHGVADGECMTLSVGFRAPSNKDLLSSYTDHQLDQLQDNQRYTDPDLEPQNNTGWIPPSAIEKVKDQLLSSLEKPNALEHWVGQYLSAAKYDNEDSEASIEPLNINDVLLCCNERIPFLRDETSRMVYTGKVCDQPELLFINGKQMDFPDSANKLVQLCCHHRSLPPNELTKALSHPENQVFFL
ncbi:MAG: cupin domain-containing protein, partial [Pseudomonadales bacterium]|nr:cupin domain-containing protein [Pseudomonadales bacterium]